MRLLVCIFIYIFLNQLDAQNKSKYDSLKNYSLDKLWDLSYFALDGTDTLKMRVYCNAFLTKAKKKGRRRAILNAYDYLTWAYPDLALAYNDSIIRLSEKRPIEHYPAQGYLGKANYYQENWKPNEALREYITTMEVAKDIGCNDHIFQAKLGVASLRGLWGDSWQALELYKQCLVYAESNEDGISYHDRINLYMDLALAHFDNKDHQEAAKYIEKAKQLARVKNDVNFYNKLLSIGGYNDVVDGRLLSGLDSLRKAEPYRTGRSLGINLYYQGKALLLLEKEEEAIHLFRRVDSMYLRNGDKYRELLDAQKILLNNARTQGNLEMVNDLSLRTLEIDSVITTRSSVFRKNAFQEYDLPSFLDQRTVFVKKLSRQNLTIWFIVIVLFITLYWGIKNWRNKLSIEKSYRKIMDFEIVLEQNTLYTQREQKTSKKSEIDLVDTNNNTVSHRKRPSLNNNSESLQSSQVLSNITIEVILSRLQKFENDLLFLDNNVGLNSLAKTFGTNHKYLSMIVNENKGQDFRNYLKDLRITYSINSIKANQDLAMLSIAQLAENFGFKSSDSFARAFKWKTKMTPSNFISKLLSDIS